MSSLLNWLSATRLRTIPLSISGIIVGSSIAYYNGFYQWTIFAGSILTAVFFQILSNFSNDYGDALKGADDYRIGPNRTVQSGLISFRKMKIAIIVTTIGALFGTFFLVYTSFKGHYTGYALFFIGLGLCAIAAAIKYTIGKFAYGYRGLGDVFVFIFFGLISVLGVLFLYTKQLSWVFVFPAIAIGLLSVAVLNLNNMRDYQTDKKARKRTLVVILGSRLSKLYHYNLVFGAMTSFMIYSLFTAYSWKSLLYFILFIPLIIHLLRVRRIKNLILFDVELKRLALLTFLISIFFAFGHITF